MRRRRSGPETEPPRWAVWLLAGVPLLFAAISLPLLLGLVAPNPLYGVRTAATYASDAAWYRANRATGVAGLAAGLVGFAANVLVLRSTRPRRRKNALCLTVLLAVTLAMVAAGLLAA